MWQVTLETSKLKEDGDRLFGRKEYQKALDAYDRALKRSGPDGKEERALLHSNKAACYLLLQRCAAAFPGSAPKHMRRELLQQHAMRNMRVELLFWSRAAWALCAPH